MTSQRQMCFFFLHIFWHPKLLFWLVFLTYESPAALMLNVCDKLKDELLKNPPDQLEKSIVTKLKTGCFCSRWIQFELNIPSSFSPSMLSWSLLRPWPAKVENCQLSTSESWLHVARGGLPKNAKFWGGKKSKRKEVGRWSGFWEHALMSKQFN